MNFFIEELCRIGAFMIVAQTIVHFRPKNTYEKYLKMLINIIVLVMLVNLLSKVINGIEYIDIDEIFREMEGAAAW